ncbi:sulfite exporter TauE/SafE family protein [Natrarchaeobius halalkaliphilus]|uniref:Sulfite exporter TauE/SafE family protein n=1 Tax=Natrarchaeobius halalkaliphilus TaxID=1679091 RepID=A0A3N6LSP8_9EURY|nr:sulfite exporter TauE/SafE family protein [Natrarchaeobius halalkaliphilus]RQG91557.1 sulfite exporter TauE/SafE family protein [Natrarchaeobius halalkaliphilus]
MDPLSLLGIDVVLFLVIGLLAGAHCIGMCGPLVTIYASRMSGEETSDVPSAGSTGASSNGRAGHLTSYEVRQHALFNIGRTASYTLLGGAFGALGGVLFVTTAQLTPIVDLARGGVGLLIGGFVIATGIYYLLGRTTGGISFPGLERVSGWLAARVDRLASGPGIVGLGAAHGLLPCPILYPAFLYAFATGSPTSGAVALAALGIGTIPAVFAYGTVIDAVDVVHRRRVHRLLGVAFVVLGYVLFAHGLMAVGIHVPHPELPFYEGIDAPGGHDHH